MDRTKPVRCNLAQVLATLAQRDRYILRDLLTARCGLPSFGINRAPSALPNELRTLARTLRCRPLVKNFFWSLGGPTVNTVQSFEIDGGRVARYARGAVAAAVLVFIAACGGGGGGGAPGELPGGGTPPEVSRCKPTATEASRFLAQATFGGNEAEINRLTGMTYSAWLDEQFAKPQQLHRLYINQAAADLTSVGQQLSNTNFWDSWWSQALGADDQLRQRVTFALSQIIVISFADATLRNQPRGVASYYDMLAGTPSATSATCSRT